MIQLKWMKMSKVSYLRLLFLPSYLTAKSDYQPERAHEDESKRLKKAQAISVVL